MTKKFASSAFLGIFLAWALGLGTIVPATGAEVPSAQEILRCTDDHMRGQTRQGRHELLVITPRWTRHRYFEYWTKGYDKAFVRITDPESERGTGSLKLGFNFWHYIAQAERTIKLAPSLMLQPWIGSDFTNDDLVQMSSISRDYTGTLVGEVEMQGFPAYQIKLVPHPNAPVVWGGLMVWTRKADCVPLKIEYYDEAGKLVRTLDYSEIKWFDDREIPAALNMQWVKTPNRKSILRALEVKYNRPIPDHIFTIENLENRGEENL